MSDVSHHAWTEKSRTKTSTKFYHRSIQVKLNYVTLQIHLRCCFHSDMLEDFFVSTWSRKTHDAVRQHFLDHGLQDRLHCNSKKLPHHGFTTAELKCIVSFVKNEEWNELINFDY